MGCGKNEERQMKILNDIISSICEDSKVHGVCCGVRWTSVKSRRCGLSSTFVDPSDHGHVRDVGSLDQKSALELVGYARSEVQLEASIGMAALNSLIDIDEDRLIELNAFDVLAREGEGKDVAIVGHFPFVPYLRNIAERLWVIEKDPREGDLPAEDAEKILPQADVVAITGTTFINHTVDELLELCRKDSLVMMVGATTPLSPVLFDYGVDMIAGSMVVDPEKAIKCICQGATFRQIEGVKHLIMKR
jgi:uncharacterized protein